MGRAAEVLTNTVAGRDQLQARLGADLPTTGNIDAYLLSAPAVHPTGPSGAYSIAGSTSFENLFMVNGVTVNENLRGQANDLYIEDAIQEATVSTGGISAEYGRFSGGVVNVVTKSGGNLFSGTIPRDDLERQMAQRSRHTKTTAIPGGGAGPQAVREAASSASCRRTNTPSGDP